MTNINQLSAVDSVQSGDQVPIFSSANGDARKASMNVIRDFMQQGITLPNGMMDIASIFALRLITPVAQAVGTAYANIPNYNQSLILPTDRSSIAPMLVAGEFVAQRDCDGILFWVALNGNWPTNRDLSLAVYVGSDAAPYESAFQFIGAGRGGGVPVTATFSGPVANLNNPGGVIKAGEKIRLVAKFNTADTLNITRIGFVIQTLDGI